MLNFVDRPLLYWSSFLSTTVSRIVVVYCGKSFSGPLFRAFLLLNSCFMANTSTICISGAHVLFSLWANSILDLSDEQWAFRISKPWALEIDHYNSKRFCEKNRRRIGVTKPRMLNSSDVDVIECVFRSIQSATKKIKWLLTGTGLITEFVEQIQYKGLTETQGKRN